MQLLVPPFTAQLGKLDMVVHIHQSASQNVVLGLLAEESSGMFIINYRFLGLIPTEFKTHVTEPRKVHFWQALQIVLWFTKI